MDPLASTFSAIRAAYGLAERQTPRRLGERVWHLPAAGGGAVVKVFALDHYGRASKEASILAHLQAPAHHPFRVQTLCRTNAGEPLWSGPDSHAMVTRWERGHFKTYDTFTPREWAALGASLAGLHARLDGLQLPGADTIYRRLTAIDVDEVRRRLVNAHECARPNGNAAELHRYVDCCLRLLDRHYRASIETFPLDDPLHPIHNDYNQFNYLFTRTAPPVILDWEAATGAPREYEVVRCMNHLPLEAPRRAETFVRAYLRVRKLRPDRIRWAVDAACLQHALKLWIIYGWLDEPARFSSHLNGAVKMATAMLNGRDDLVDFFTRYVNAER